jgi:acyl-CoA synthetase (NDP forming)
MASSKYNHWKYLFAPDSVAVIGAVDIPGTWGFGIMRHLLESANRSIYPVNPTVSEILGIATYDSVLDIPSPIDLAVIAVNASQVPDVLRECVHKGVRTAVIISAGFAETDEQGYHLQNELVEIARQGDLRFIGPNCMGHADTLSRLSTLAWSEEITAGSVGLISQSGNYAGLIIRTGMASGIGFSKFVSTGNEADLHMEDYLEYLAQDQDTKIITAYIEGLREGRRFFQLAKEATTRKPVIVIKVGGTKESARAVMSHTAALAGSDAVHDAAFRQAGVIRVHDSDEMCDVLAALLNQPLPRNNRIGILTIGGGPGVVAAEACEQEGLEVAPLSPSTMKKLNAYLPSRWSHGNPVDTVGIVASQRQFLFSSLLALMEDENVDAILLLVPVVLSSERISTFLGLSGQETKVFQEMQKENLSMVRERAKECGKPMFVVPMSRDEEASSFLFRVGIPAYHSPQRAARVLRHLAWYSHYLDSAKQ